MRCWFWCWECRDRVPGNGTSLPQQDETEVAQVTAMRSKDIDPSVQTFPQSHWMRFPTPRQHLAHGNAF